jgi:hypothetical protein
MKMVADIEARQPQLHREKIFSAGIATKIRSVTIQGSSAGDINFLTSDFSTSL